MYCHYYIIPIYIYIVISGVWYTHTDPKIAQILIIIFSFRLKHLKHVLNSFFVVLIFLSLFLILSPSQMFAFDLNRVVHAPTTVPHTHTVSFSRISLFISLCSSLTVMSLFSPMFQKLKLVPEPLNKAHALSSSFHTS